MMCTTRWQLHVAFVRHLPAWLQNIWDHQLVCKGKHDKECAEHDAHEVHRKAQKSQDSKKEWKSHKSKKHPNWNHAEQNATLCPTPFLATPVNDYSFYLWMIPHSFPIWSHIVFFIKPSLNQMNCLILFTSHSCCSVMVYISCIHPGILFLILYWSLTILSYTLHFILNLYFTQNILITVNMQ